MQLPNTITAPPEVLKLETASAALVVRAEASVITTQAEYTAAGPLVQEAAAQRKRIIAEFRPLKSLLDLAHKEACRLENLALRNPLRAEAILKGKMSAFLVEDAARRREEEARERERLRGIEEDRKLQEAIDLEAAGETEEAEQVLAEETHAPVVEFVKPAAEGVSYRKKFTFEIVDASAINRRFLIPDEVTIRKQVNALGKDAAAIVGGIVVHEELVMAVRA